MKKNLIICDICEDEIETDDKAYVHITVEMERYLAGGWHFNGDTESYDMHLECLEHIKEMIKEQL